MILISDILKIRTVKSKRCKKLYHMNSNQKKAGIVIIISIQLNFKARSINKN